MALPSSLLSPKQANVQTIEKTKGPFMSYAELKGNLALADLIRDIADAQEERKKQFAAIVRVVRHREATGPANDMMEQIGATRNSANCL